jgi:hypothetical protein
MNKQTIFAGLAFLAAGSALMGQVTASGTLNITGSVDPSISLTFISDGAGVPLTGSGTDTATLPFGTVKAFGYAGGTGITQALVGGSTPTAFSVASPVGVQVLKANSASATYTLSAGLGTADALNIWSVDAVNVGTGTPTITVTGAYGSAVSHTVKITVPLTNASILSLVNSIGFVATAN